MKLYTDASRDELIVGLGWVIKDNGHTVKGNRFMRGEYTSMEAEFYALVDGLRHSSRIECDRIDVYVDCQPLVKKMRIPDGNSQDWYDRRQGCHWLLNKFDEWNLEWISRTHNESANRMAYEALEEGRRP